MRINIEVPERQEELASTSSSRNAPPTLARLAPSGELVLIELQGSLEIDDAHPDGGEVLGKLEFHKGREERPTLLISHHRLEGKIVALTKPFAVLEKKKRAKSSSKNDPGNEFSSRPTMKRIDVNQTKTQRRDQQGNICLASSPTAFSSKRGAANHVSNDVDYEDDHHLDEITRLDEDGPSSPSLFRKRAKVDEAQGSDRTPVVKGNMHRAKGVASSSPMPKAPMRGSELDFSSPISNRRIQFTTTSHVRPDIESEQADRVGEEDDEDWLHRKSTSTYFEVVCIIRKKILFTKRPEPVVRLDIEEGDKARVVLQQDVAVA